jgi:hypothetical protein
MVRNTGSAGVFEQGKGTGRVTRKPERSCLCPREITGYGAPVEQRSRPGARLGGDGSAKAITNDRGHAETRGEDIS